ncbi:MAG: SDR family oxidoreductase [Planctomycetes bacterium]|nr:SDR family oxidoreductase [Planctomycetota bacterium]
MNPQIRPRRVALIPGGARGIGRAIGLDLASHGWDVAIAYRKSADDAASFVRLAGDTGARTLAMCADVSDANAAEALARATADAFGRVDALIHAAGPYHRVDLLNETPERWREMFDHNLHSLFYVAKAVAPGMQERRFGRIVAFSMATADRVSAQPGVTAHFIAKMGVQVLMKSLAKTLAPYGVTANTISPGFLDSGSAEADELAKMLKFIPAGSIGKLDDAVAAARFLLSDEASYVNGANIQLSGAWGI